MYQSMYEAPRKLEERQQSAGLRLERGNRE